MFETLNERKAALKNHQYNKTKWMNQLAVYHLEHQQRQKEKATLTSKIETYTKDIAKLKKISFISLLAKLTRSTDERIRQKEHQLARIKLKDERMKQELKQIGQRTKEIQEKIDKLPDLDKELASILTEQGQIIEGIGSYVARQYTKVNDRITNLESFLKRTKEASAKGEKVKKNFAEARALLKKAERWGALDMLGGRGYSAHKKHQYINEANQVIQTAQIKRKLFQRELSDMQDEKDLDLQMHESLIFADFVFDGIFIDYIVQQEIEDSIDKVDIQINEVNKFILHLDFRYKHVSKEIDQCKDERMKLFDTLK